MRFLRLEVSIITINFPLFKKLRDNLRGQKSLGPLKMSLEMAHKVIVPQKNMSRSFLNSGKLIVIMETSSLRNLKIMARNLNEIVRS